MKLNIKLNKKNIIIIASAAFILLLTIILIIFLAKKNEQAPKNAVNNINNSENFTSVFVPEFLSAEEKAKMQIPADDKIEVIKRNGQGEVEVYKIIRNDSDIIDPAKIQPISPQENGR